MAGLKHGHSRSKHLATSVVVIPNGERDLLFSSPRLRPVGPRSHPCRGTACRARRDGFEPALL